MNRRINKHFPFSPNSGIHSRSGEVLLYSGELDTTEVAYGLYSATGICGTVRPSCDAPHSLSQNVYSGAFALERAISNAITVTIGLDALKLTDWLSRDGFGAPVCVVTVTENFADGPWGPDGVKATKIVKTGDPATSYFYYTGAISTASVGTNYMTSVYVKVLSGTLQVSDNIADTQNVSAGSGWTRVELSSPGDGVSTAQCLFITPGGTGDSVTFLTCCAQVESSPTYDFCTSFVDGSRPAAAASAPTLAFDIQNFSFSAWIAPHRASSISVTGTILLILEDSSASVGRRFIVNRSLSTDQFTITIATDIQSETTTTINTSWSDGEWHHIFLTMDNGVGAFYIDGVLASAISGTQRKFFTIDSIKFIGTVGNSFNGLLSDVVFYNSALTEAEVAALYVAYGSGTPTPLFYNLSMSTLPQPTESATDERRAPVVRLITENGSHYIDSVTATTNNKIQLHYGPLQNLEVHQILDFYGANTEYGTFYYTDLEGKKGLYRFGERGFQVTTTRPNLHNISLEIESVA